MYMLLAIACGGALGALARHKVGSVAMLLFGSGFPYGTIIVNIVGSFLLGLLAGGLAFKLSLPQEARAFLNGLAFAVPPWRLSWRCFCLQIMFRD